MKGDKKCNHLIYTGIDGNLLNNPLNANKGTKTTLVIAVTLPISLNKVEQKKPKEFPAADINKLIKSKLKIKYKNIESTKIH